ncbi:hypothetical protein BGZ96_006328 [Linnemannia gamsii]|uniref:Uncharacterized protein n=1 Tax=Linnemannia gamsii TaxID=64522 RepID=A0ABQ7K2N1_9FUNG|nr:hypothetical protein BGZ96_006328 [Linnemannia gamsii]
MKFTFLAFSAIAIASYSNVHGFPAIIKRIVGEDNFVMRKPLTEDCKLAVTIDTGIIQSVDLQSFSMDFRGTNPSVITVSSDAVSVVLLDIGVPWLVSEAKESRLILCILRTALGGSGGIPDAAAKVAGLVAGLVAVPNIGLKSDVTLKGFRNLNNGDEVSYVRMVSYAKDANGFTLTSIINIANPTEITAYASELTFNTFKVGTNDPIGDSVISDFTLVPGNTNELVVVITSKNPAILDGLLAQSSDWYMGGTLTSTKNPHLAKGAAKLMMLVRIPQLTV